MSQRELRAQRQKEQDERRLSLQRNNAYFTVVSDARECQISHPVNDLAPAECKRSRSCSPMLMTARSEPERTESVSLTLSPFQTVSSSLATSTVITISTATAPLATTTATTSTSTLCSIPTAVYNSAEPTTTKVRALTPTLESKSGQEPKQNKKLCQTGLDRYIQIKRKLSPQHKQGNQPKINRANAANDSSSNRFALLDDCEVQEQEQKKIKPPPIYIREKTSSALVNKLVAIIGENKFHVIPLTKGNIQETKVQTQDESSHRSVTKYLDEAGKSYYTYQLKSAKGLQVVIKGIESSVTSSEIIAALKEKNFNAKTVINILNRNKEPQPLFKVELEPSSQKNNKNEVHPIYTLQYLLHRRITVEEPHKRRQPVQCTNCQEYGHTKAYCTLKSICVVCSDAHSTVNCPKNKNDSSIKLCSNCGEKHTANWRGCIVYKELKSRLNKRVDSARDRIEPTIHKVMEPTTTNIPSSASHRTMPNSSFASVLKSGIKVPTAVTSSVQHNISQINANKQLNTQNMQQQPIGIEAIMLSMQQSMKDFMTFMQETMQELMRNQNILIQMLVSSKTG